MTEQSHIQGHQQGQHIQAIQRVAVVGTGVIGASWVAYFLAQGLDVSATDPMPGAEEKLHAAIQQHWPSLETLGLKPGASISRLRFSSDLAETSISFRRTVPSAKISRLICSAAWTPCCRRM
jgi:3-hydroxyacyl-CoA dehydrogenase